MNLFTTPSSQFFLPLSSLNPLFTQLHDSLNDPNVGHKDRSLLEQTIWTKIKDVRKLNNEELLTHFIRFYESILLTPLTDSNIDDSFLYNVLIRLGDLNRYVQQPEVAARYYRRARNLIPSFGHAYNQLGLLTDSSSIYKRCYYYARAAKPSDRPFASADGNLRLIVNNLESDILNAVLDNLVNFEDIGERNLEPSTKLPQTASEWFCVIVVALYANNIGSVAKAFLNYFTDNWHPEAVSVQRDASPTSYCDTSSYLLLASHDIFLDSLRSSVQGKESIKSISLELRKIRSMLRSSQFVVDSGIEVSSNSNSNSSPSKATSSGSSQRVSGPDSSDTILSDSTTDWFDSTQRSRATSMNEFDQAALIHDYILRGFAPMNAVHDQLSFNQDSRISSIVNRIEESDDEQALISTPIEISEVASLLTRIKTKMDSLLPPIKKQSRNIALQSILSNVAAKNAGFE